MSNGALDHCIYLTNNQVCNKNPLFPYITIALVAFLYSYYNKSTGTIILFIKILLFYYNFYSTSRGTGKNMPRLSLSHTLTWPWGAEKCPKRSPEIPRWQQAYPLLQADGSRQDVKSGGGTYVIIFSTEHSWRVQNYHKGHLRRGSLEFCNQISVHP